jgi:ribose 5-phosphate isomerase RpiB
MPVVVFFRPLGICMTIALGCDHGGFAAKDEFTARCAGENYHCNILSIDVDLIGGKDLCKLVEVFLLATVSPGRHARRMEKLKKVKELLAQATLRTKIRRSRHSFENHL